VVVHLDTVTRAVGVTLQADRKIVVGGHTGPDYSHLDFAALRLLNPPDCRVPNVRGKKLQAARSAIKKGNCGVGKVKRKPSRRVKRGRVISQSPKPRTILSNRGKVSLVVSKGRRTRS
jgi:beta-lactam-binding protein with PASTA domain